MVGWACLVSLGSWSGRAAEASAPLQPKYRGTVETVNQGGSPAAGLQNGPPRVVLVLGENEYRTWETLPNFAREELEPRGLQWASVTAPPAGGHDFTNIDALKTADLLVISVRRRTPPQAMLDLIHRHLEAGKPLVGLRTASHAFDAKPADAQHGAWSRFDLEVLGGHYDGHYGNDLSPAVRLAPGAGLHPVMNGVAIETFRTPYSLYRGRDLAATATPLLTGTVVVDGREVAEPVAWCNTGSNRRVFYTSLGGPDDFKQPAFRRLLLNGMLWAMNDLKRAESNRTVQPKH